MLPKGYEKKSFLRVDTNIDIDNLRKEFDYIPEQEWSSSYWGHVHCSIGMLLLRGGKQGTPEDLFCDEVFDYPILDNLPYIKYLLSKEGPFGGAYFAFFFKTKPKGVTLRHQDLMQKWQDLYRVHIPIYTNPGAYLISNNYSQHYSTGYAWLFDNHENHGVVNGDEERVHLIFDVAFNPKIKSLIDDSKYFKGEYIKKNNIAITNKSKAIPSYIGDVQMKNAITTLRSRGVGDEDIAKFFNTKKIISKGYPPKDWDENMVKDLC